MGRTCGGGIVAGKLYLEPSFLSGLRFENHVLSALEAWGSASHEDLRSDFFVISSVQPVGSPNDHWDRGPERDGGGMGTT
ncbi:hypothetical protein TIFTF001_015151 [Ficus carica]|uniref:Uncharacterized protein n=1 Tax=Ficus carica TaxID=3494 RepID=A0AA88A7A8_FICCA|nr:hypothetical protein TIFTF001_015151 [Ficus carica]